MVRKTLLLLCMGTALVILTACGQEEAQEKLDTVQETATEIKAAAETKAAEAVEAAENKVGEVMGIFQGETEPPVNDAEGQAPEMTEDMEEKPTEGY